MKYLSILFLIIITSCKNVSSINEAQKKDFENLAKEYQKKYMDGSENCEYILDALDENIKMSESQFGQPVMDISYEQLVKYCPHLPKKEVISTITEQRLITSNLGYDYVSQLYLRKSVGDTVRETSSRIWEKKNEAWKIIQMNNSLNKACDK
jgi:hypothetical protein